jgi:ribonuclease P protein component
VLTYENVRSAPVLEKLRICLSLANLMSVYKVLKIESIKKRADFLRISAQGTKCIVSNFIMLSAPMPEGQKVDVRFGLTVTKKVGNAVVRNRIKRRLREAFKQVAPAHAEAGHDYVMIPRKSALLCPYGALIGDLQFALPRLRKK